MFGYAAPVVKPPVPGQPAQPAQPAAPAWQPPPAAPQPGFPPPAAAPQPGFPPPAAPPAAPAWQPPPAAPQPGFPPPAAPPPAMGGGFPGQPPPPMGGQPGYPPPPAMGGGFPGQPPAPAPQPGYPPPPMGGGQPPPPMGGGQPPPQMGGGFQPPPPMGGGGFQPPPPAQPGYPPPPAQPGYPPPPAQPGYPPPPAGAFAAPQQDLPGPLDNLARAMPGSQPGTLFGVPLARLRDPGLQRKALFVLGIALAAAVFVPLTTEPKMYFAWDVSFFKGMLWPLLAAASYLLVAAAPPNIRNQVPPIVLEWLPFGVSFAGIQIVGIGPLAMLPGASPGGAWYLYSIGMAVLLFGLLARLQNPNDQTARIIVAVGAGCLLLPWIDFLGEAFKFSHVGFVMIIHNLLFFLVLLLGIACALYVVPPAKLPPALKAIDALAPLVTAVIALWLPLQVILVGLGLWLAPGMGLGFLTALLLMVRGLMILAAYFGVLMLTAPAAFDSLMASMKKGQQPPPPPAPGGGYPPPPPGGGYPPPPPGGGYPPPPAQGGGWPQQ
jgi:hypothetical protein